MSLSADRNTPSRSGREFSFPIAAATKIYAGSLVCLNAAGNAIPGAVATTLLAVGRAKHTVDNSGGSAGDLSIDVERGCFRFANSASTDAITLAQYGKSCYVIDDQTVAKTDGSAARSVAGVVRDVDANGVWVEF